MPIPLPLRLTAGVLALGLAACEFMPGTEAHRVAQAKRAVATMLIDPASAQFRNVSARNGYVCGELNGKNRTGGFVGFKRFVVKLDGEDALIDPEFDYADLLSADESCRSLSQNSYASLSTSLSACQRAAEQRSAANLQASFDDRWQNHCSFTSKATVYRPPLADTPSALDADEVLPRPAEPSGANEPTDMVDAESVAANAADTTPSVDADGNPITSADLDDSDNAIEKYNRPLPSGGNR